MKKLLVLISFFLFSVLVFSQTTDTTIEIIGDQNFSDGIGLQGLSTSDPSVIDTLYPFGKGNAGYTWELAQWFSRFNLKGVQPLNIGDSVVYADSGKKVTFLPVNGGTQVDLEVFGSNEYLSPRKAGESWPHLLLQQTFPHKQRLDKIDSLTVNMKARLMYCQNKMDSTSYNPNLHSAQFSLYLTVQNLNANSSDYGDYLWFGLHLYDYRYKVIPLYEAADAGKADATGKFIYSPASNEIYAGYFQDKNWISISKNILPDINLAFQAAQARGYLKGSSINDMYIASMNIGWEVTGTFNCGFQYKDLSLTAQIKKVNNSNNTEWNFTKGLDGWGSFWNMTSSFSTKDSAVVLTATGTYPHFLSPDYLNINASLFSSISVTMKNNTNVAIGDFYWITNADPNYSESQTTSAFPISTNDTVFKEYTIPLTNAPGWSGTIRQLRFDPIHNATSGSVEIKQIKLNSITGVKQENTNLPHEYSLSQNYPNPFNPSTEIRYSIPHSGFVTLKVYNLLGQEVANLVNRDQKIGTYTVNFNASKLASGVYIYRLQSNGFSLSKKMLLIK